MSQQEKKDRIAIVRQFFVILYSFGHDVQLFRHRCIIDNIREAGSTAIDSVRYICFLPFT
jgi:hypothetical protein